MATNKSAYMKEYYAANRERIRENAHRRYLRDRDRLREEAVGQRLRSRYGITLEEYEDRLETQGGVCAICRVECKTGQRLSVDHSHETGEVRGLLCRACNFRLGQIEKPGLQAFLDYLM